MRAWTLPEVCLGIVGFFLAFLIPAVIFAAAVKVKKIKVTPFIIYVGFGTVWFVGSLILILVDPRSRQLTWLTIVAWALAAGLLGFLGLALSDGLMRVLGRPNTETAIKELSSLAKRQNESPGSEDVNPIQPK